MRAASVLALLLCASPAFGQTAWPGRIRAGISAGVQPASAGLTTMTSAVEYLEPAPISAETARSTIPVIDAGLGVRVAGDLGLGLAVSRAQGSNDAAVSAAVPHPFHFDRPRLVEGEAFGARRAETAVHASVLYVLGWTRRADVTLLGGATYFHVRQDVVTGVTYAETYPFDAAAFSSAELTELALGRLGYHAGVDVAWRHSARWAVGGLVRFSRARIPVDANGARAGTLQAGGLQAAAGVRVSFGMRRAQP